MPVVVVVVVVVLCPSIVVYVLRSMPLRSFVNECAFVQLVLRLFIFGVAVVSHSFITIFSFTPIETSPQLLLCTVHSVDLVHCRFIAYDECCV